MGSDHAVERHSLVATAGVRQDGELVGAVVLAVDSTVAASDIARSWLWVAAGCLVVLVVAAIVARALTRWVLRPLDGLERAVAEMTEGIAGPPADVAGPPELRHYTSAFNTMAQVVRASLDRQRRLVADASHQLRNPLAAVRLRADSLADVGDRFGATDLSLDDGRARPTGESARAADAAGARRAGQRKPPGRVCRRPQTSRTDLHDVVAERIAFWQPVADGQRAAIARPLRDPGLAVQLARHDVEQLLDVALDNALRYAGPGTTVTVSTEQSDRDRRFDRQRRRLRPSGRRLVEGGCAVLARAGRRRGNRPRIGDRRRDRCGPRRHGRRGEGARKAVCWSVSGYRWRVIRSAEQSTDPDRPSHIPVRARPRWPPGAFVVARADGCGWRQEIRAGCISRSLRFSPNR